MNEKEIIKDFVRFVKSDDAEITDEICIRTYDERFDNYIYMYLRLDYKGDVVGMWKREYETIRKASSWQVVLFIWDFYREDFKRFEEVLEIVNPRWFFE